mgnify:CR=1
MEICGNQDNGDVMYTYGHTEHLTQSNIKNCIHVIFQRSTPRVNDKTQRTLLVSACTQLRSFLQVRKLGCEITRAVEKA